MSKGVSSESLTDRRPGRVTSVTSSIDGTTGGIHQEVHVENRYERGRVQAILSFLSSVFGLGGTRVEMHANTGNRTSLTMADVQARSANATMGGEGSKVRGGGEIGSTDHWAAGGTPSNPASYSDAELQAISNDWR